MLMVNGDATLAGLLSVWTVDGFNFPNGSSIYTIMGFSNLSGDFDSMSLNGTSCASGGADMWNCGAHLTISEQIYANHLDLVIEAPEPGTLAVLGFSLAALGFARRRAARPHAA